jgi:hypothetical protein
MGLGFNPRTIFILFVILLFLVSLEIRIPGKLNPGVSHPKRGMANDLGCIFFSKQV